MRDAEMQRCGGVCRRRERELKPLQVWAELQGAAGAYERHLDRVSDAPAPAPALRARRRTPSDQPALSSAAITHAPHKAHKPRADGGAGDGRHRIDPLTLQPVTGQLCAVIVHPLSISFESSLIPSPRCAMAAGWMWGWRERTREAAAHASPRKTARELRRAQSPHVASRTGRHGDPHGERDPEACRAS